MDRDPLVAKWRVVQQQDRILIIEYDVPDLNEAGKTKTDKVRIDNFNPGAAEDILREAIKAAVRGHYRKHRFVGLTGEVTLDLLDTDDDPEDVNGVKGEEQHDDKARS